MKLKTLMASVAAVSTLAAASLATAGVLPLNAGWVYDQLDAAGSPTQNSPWTFTLSGPGHFRLTDAFNTGDTYTVSGSFGGVTAVGAGPALTPIGDPTGEAAWESGNYGILDVLLGAGSYSVSITGDGGGGIPAGLYVRLDSAVPEASTWALMIVGFGLAGVAMRQRRRTYA